MKSQFLAFLLISTSLSVFAEDNQVPWTRAEETIACRVRGIDSRGRLSGYLQSSWEGDGFSGNGSGVYEVGASELTNPNESLAMISFPVGKKSNRNSEDNYVEVHLDIDTTSDKRLAFYIYQGGSRDRSGNSEVVGPSLMTQLLYSEKEWQEAGRQFKFTLQLLPNRANKYTSISLKCWVQKFQ